MRFPLILAALLSTALATPALAQRDGGFRPAEPIERGDIARPVGGGNEGRRGWQPRERAPQIERQEPAAQSAPPSPERQWSGRRGPVGGEWQRPAPPAGVVTGNEGGWQRRSAPPVAQGVPPVPGNLGVAPDRRDWRRGDRDRDGVPNWRDRDRDGDGVANRRDWDRNNDGRVDRRWDWNRNGVPDRRYDWDRDGRRDYGWRGNDRDRDGWRDRGDWNRGPAYGWNRDWRRDRRYDWQGWRYQNRNLFRAPRYVSPYGWGYGYRRFGIGIYLDNVFFGSSYWLSDPWRYRLPEARWPYRWVRYYDDVLLVDTRSGYVVDVIYDFFW